MIARIKKKHLLTMMVCLLIAALTACGQGSQEPAEDPAPAETGQQQPEETVEPEGPLTLTGGGTQEEAEEILSNAKYRGTCSEELWISFTTGKEGEYAFALTNLTPESGSLYGHLFDSEGNMLEPDEVNYNRDQGNTTSPGSIVQGSDSGRTGTGKIAGLSPDTTYYLRLRGHGAADFCLTIKDPAQEQILGVTEKEALEDPASFHAASNQDEAPLLVLNETYYGEYEEGYAWVCFTTGPKKGELYTVTLENVTPGSDSVYGHLYGADGTMLQPVSINYTRSQGNSVSPDSIVQGRSDGRAATGSIDTLDPNATYYIRLRGGSQADYLIRVGSSAAPVPDHASGSAEADLLTPVDSITPGISQSSAIRVPLGTKVSGEYKEGYQWFAFTTGPQQGAEYYVTCINCTPGSDSLYGHLYEADGTLLQPVRINYTRSQGNTISPDSVVQGRHDGRAATGSIDTLRPNTTYYVCLQSGSPAEYTLLVTAPENREAASHRTSSSMAEAVGALSAEDPLVTGTNQNAASVLKHNVWYYGTYEDGYLWVSFLTGSEEKEYSVALENLSPDSSRLYGHLFDEYGTLIVPDSINYSRAQGNTISPDSIVQGDTDGFEAVGSVVSLKPDTMYYVRLQGEAAAEYKIMIGTPENDGIEEPEGAVFETPFELNETQVRFVADEATFIDKAAAKAALAPVAEVILAHPGSSILLAGTTATFGDQVACVKLSNARAEAVKNMLVNEFGVPADQLKTVGLGYEDDPFERGRDRDENGGFVRTEAAKNRRVVVLDAESALAKEVLGE
ncbi:MAG: OmpA family protein [Firmicutes bacterium]|nr:OmpA family protein [Bacillota bacterium]